MEVERVQLIASFCASDAGAIPPEFIRSDHEQPCLTTFLGPAPAIPVIDLAAFDGPEITRAIAEASREWGIFQVVGHGVPEEAMRELQRAGREFFEELPQEEKEKYARKDAGGGAPANGGQEGYGTKLQRELEGKKAWVDFFFHYIAPPSKVNHRIWPVLPATDYRKITEEYAKYVVNLVDRMLTELSKGLELEDQALKEAVGGDSLNLNLKINYYPPCPRPDVALGVVAHTDMSAMTILVPNDVPGLQILKDDLWINVDYVPNAIIVHIGDQIEILSNGIYKSVLHRSTVSKDKVRMSWPVFCSPPGDSVIGPLQQVVNEDNPPKYKAKMFKDYAYCKINKLPQ
ncbi:flavonol synthase/flavanone 3-hydroxylase-like [Zingiber officinale]|uniref:Fe2OG dioxygenase domain-containing protein n=1 Tax=Zingiber officinale TaxID=94328 RepID=A0A8J5KWJ4_ZINOF|nr:flavonol synthase/flavanone 3-hydroxylase-like [Zingiber officinale]KAG6495837.1 hypothetical protein ZIOFF_043666 [Zingiber officinale]